MKKLVLVIASVVLIAGVAFAQSCSVQAYFGSPASTQTIKAVIIQAINRAASSLDIAILSFTDNDIGDAVVRAARRGVSVRVILGAGQDEMLGSQHEKLQRANANIVVVSQQVMLNHAFALIDNQAVITGSYNWSDYSQKSRYDSVVIISCPTGTSVLKQFAEEFEKMWAKFRLEKANISTQPTFPATLQPVVIHSVDPAAQCIQLLNVTDLPIDITGWQLSDLEGTYEFPSDTILYPDEPYEICRATYNPAYDLEDLYLDDDDEVLLLNPDGRIIDETVWGKSG